MNSQPRASERARQAWQPGGAWTHRSGDLVPLQPKQICHSRAGFQRSQSSIVSDKPVPLSGQRGLLELALPWLLHTQKEPGDLFCQAGADKSDSFRAAHQH